MPKPRFGNTHGADVETLRKDVAEMAEELGPSAGSKLLGMVAIATTETAIPHGQKKPPHWRIYDGPSDQAQVWQNRAADDRFLYLIASDDITVGVEIF